MSEFITKPIPDIKPDVEQVVRPWGSFSQYANNEDVTVSLMTVNPNQRLSFQSHTAHAELWIVMDDNAIIQVDDEIIRAKAGDEIWIPQGAKHRLSNDSHTPIRVLEVAFGNWQIEDITRYDDDYNRPADGDSVV